MRALDRRGFIASAAAMPWLILSSISFASETSDCFENMTVGEYLRMFSPDVYQSLDPDFKDLLDSSPMYSKAPASRASLGQTVSISAWRAGSGAVGYNFSFSCSDWCPSLYALVTVTNLTTNVSRSSEHWGSGLNLSSSGTLYGLGTGSCRAVVTAFSPEPPVGMSSYYSQDWYTVTV